MINPLAGACMTTSLGGMFLLSVLDSLAPEHFGDWFSALLPFVIISHPVNHIKFPFLLLLGGCSFVLAYIYLGPNTWG